MIRTRARRHTVFSVSNMCSRSAHFKSPWSNITEYYRKYWTIQGDILGEAHREKCHKSAPPNLNVTGKN